MMTPPPVFLHATTDGADMIFAVAKECVDLGLRAGAIVFRSVRIEPSDPDLRAQLVQAAQAIRTRFTDIQAARATPQIATYHEILRKVGVNPRREQNSVDRLVGFALKRRDLPAINNLVDAYNLVSLRSLCSLGAHDLDRISLPVELRLFSGRESFTPLGRHLPAEVRAGEFGYVDAAGRVLCRLDVLQADFSKVTVSTSKALLIVEGNTAHTAATLRQAVDDVIDLVSRHCGGNAEIVAHP
jgi:DNA/RNA-binding domain of Phe-tRNA-synthetase-like protein